MSQSKMKITRDVVPVPTVLFSPARPGGLPRYIELRVPCKSRIGYRTLFWSTGHILAFYLGSWRLHNLVDLIRFGGRVRRRPRHK